MNATAAARTPRPPARHFPIGRLTALAAVIVAIVLLARAGGAPRFHTLWPGIEFGLLNGDPYCRRGSSDIAVLRLDPSKVRIRAASCASQPERVPLDILEWQRRLGAAAVFNAGQYYPDFSYMGLLVSGGRVVSSHLHPGFKAALVAGPRGGGSGARVLDLERHPLDPAALRWAEVAQSFMLFDEAGHVRVRKTTQIANRTAVAEDRSGRLVVLTTEGGYTLWEFAGLLKSSPLGLTHAMSMDGGDEAVLCVHVGGFRYASYGHWDENGQVPNPRNATVPLPAVIAVSTP
jgi:uncharacterized protein YigE (DUF2233 family)